MAGVSLPYLIPSHVLGGPDRPGPNEKVHVGVIGCGGRSRLISEAADVKAFQVVAACDCMFPRAEAFVKELSGGAKWGAYQDFRKMIEKEKLDGVMVETTTHARAWIVIQAMQAGMDVYIEKPMCLTIAEGRAMVDAARKYNRVTQVGTQQRSMPINNWASDLVKNGALGQDSDRDRPQLRRPRAVDRPARRADARRRQRQLVGRLDQSGRVAAVPHAIHHGWDRWWDYDGGGRCFGVTGWGTHSYDQINRGLGTDDTGPVEILLEEPVKVRDTGKFARKLRSGGIIAAEDTGTDYHGMAQARPARGRRSR